MHGRTHYRKKCIGFVYSELLKPLEMKFSEFHKLGMEPDYFFFKFVNYHMYALSGHD